MEALEFFNFMRLVLGKEPENSNPLAHYFMIDMVFGNITRDDLPYKSEEIKKRLTFKKSFFAVLAHREFSKSTILGTFVPLYMAYKGSFPKRGKIHYGVYIADSMENNVKTTMNTISAVAQESRFLKDYFESWKFTDTQVQFARRGTGPKTSRIFTMRGFGAQTGVRGQRQALTRPQFAIIDDTVKSASDADSSVILKRINQTIHDDVRPGLSTSGNFTIAIGTPYNKHDPIYSIIESGVATPIVFPVAEHFDGNTVAKTFKGSWLDRHSFKSVRLKYEEAMAMGSSTGFTREMMLQIVDPSTQLVDVNRLKETAVSAKDLYNIGQQLNWYITTDLTATGNKSSNLAGVMLWALDKDNILYIVDLKLKIMSVEDQYDTIFEYVERVKEWTEFVTVGVEVDGQQSLHIKALEKEMFSREIWFSFAKYINVNAQTRKGISAAFTGKSKLQRLKVGVPKLDAGMIRIAQEVIRSDSGKELLDNELALVTHDAILSRYDDGIDTLSQIFFMKTFPPNSDAYEEEVRQQRIERTKYTGLYGEDDTEEIPDEISIQRYLP
jgi:hypothetical protein